MKKLIQNKLSYLILIQFLFCACENEIPFNPDSNRSQLIMNALLMADSTENRVYLSLSGAQHINYINQGYITLYVNGKECETLEDITPQGEEQNDCKLPKDTVLYGQTFYYDREEYALKKARTYRMRTRLHPGDQIMLKAKADEKYQAQATTIVPYPVAPFQMDTLHVQMSAGYGMTFPGIHFHIGLTDRLNEANYYRLSILSGVHQHQREQYGGVTFHKEWDMYINSIEDYILNEGNPHSNTEYVNAEFPIILNEYQVFSDHLFRNANCSMDVYCLTPQFWSETFDTGEEDYWNYFDYLHHWLRVRILSIDELQYRYFKALNLLKSPDYEESFMEPIIIPSNVEGGLGFVGACSATTTFINLYEKSCP